MTGKIHLTLPIKAVPGSNRKIAVNGRVIDVAKGKAGFVAQVKLLAQTEAAKRGWTAEKSPVGVSYRFCFARPASHFGTGRNAGIVKDSAPDRHTQRPDLVNLLKCLEDALTGILWADDKSVVDIDAAKFWSATDFIEIEVEKIDEE